LQFFLCGVVALAAAAPIGAVSILTIQRALSYGFWRAFWPTLGAVTANGIFGVIAALGTGYLTTAIIGGKFWLRLAGSIILVILGFKFFTRRPAKGNIPQEGFGAVKLSFLYLTLVLSNPLTLGFYLAAFTMLGLKSGHLLARQSIIMGGGIVFGAMAWFAFICLTAGKFHMRIGDRLLARIRKGVGVMFILMGLITAVSLMVAGK
jgi:threonine/homoserine/homoserine lactone efflux protein